jgi:hypothetical protein
MISLILWLATLNNVFAQVTTLTGTGTGVTLSGDNALPTGSQVTYLTYNTTMTLSSLTSTTSLSTTLLTGTTIAPNATTTSVASQTSSSTTAVNTQACNSYVEFCTRKYSNITMVTAHNFPFAIKGNAASNQQYGVIDQLNDGIRMCSSLPEMPIYQSF